jgi:hypothetical protein
MIGAKTLAGLALLVAALAAVIGLGSLAPDRLVMRGFGTLLLVGAFGVVVGTLMFRFWRFGEKSRHYFRWSTEPSAWDVSEGHFVGGDRRRIVLGENREGEAYDLPPRARHAMSVVIALLLALVAIDAHAIEQLGRAYEGVVSATATYCPEEEEEKPPAKDPNEPGCELVRRAYALGYAKSLGDCAPKKEQHAAAARPVCTRRQRDEPLLHYSWRLFSGFWKNLRSTTRIGYFKQARQDFRERSARLVSLGKTQGQMLASAPHASHHIWTNLPDPGDDAFQETTCTNRYLRLPHRPTPPPGPTQASKVFEHVVAQLLFEATYEPAAGHCREYHVHWGAPVDACARLVANPEAFLKADSALAKVRVTLERYRLAGDLVALGGPKPGADPASFVSFQCYIEGAAAERKSTPFTLLGVRFTADDLHVAPSPPNAALYIDRYDAVARLLVSGFHYGRLLSEEGLEQGSAAGLETSFIASDFLLTRLYELESIDIYLDPGWMAHRPDLLDVYPYERHLKNYVQVFRRQYRRERGRL